MDIYTYFSSFLVYVLALPYKILQENWEVILIWSSTHSLHTIKIVFIAFIIIKLPKIDPLISLSRYSTFRKNLKKIRITYFSKFTSLQTKVNLQSNRVNYSQNIF